MQKQLLGLKSQCDCSNAAARHTERAQTDGTLTRVPASHHFTSHPNVKELRAKSTSGRNGLEGDKSSPGLPRVQGSSLAVTVPAAGRNVHMDEDTAVEVMPWLNHHCYRKARIAFKHQLLLIFKDTSLQSDIPDGNASERRAGG